MSGHSFESQLSYPGVSLQMKRGEQLSEAVPPFGSLTNVIGRTDFGLPIECNTYFTLIYFRVSCLLPVPNMTDLLLHKSSRFQIHAVAPCVHSNILIRISLKIIPTGTSMGMIGW